MRYLGGGGGGGGSGTSYSIIGLTSGEDVIAAGNTRYINFDHKHTTEARAQLPIPVAGTIKNLYIMMTQNIAAGESLVCTARKNGADQTLTCTVTAGNSTASDTVNSFAVAAGDKVSIKVVASNNGSWAADYCNITYILEVT